MKTPKPKYLTLQAWMEGTRTNATQLLHRVREETGHSISAPLFSMILRGSRRCSRFNAFALSMVTGVPMDSMTEWPPKVHGSDNSLADAKTPQVER